MLEARIYEWGGEVFAPFVMAGKTTPLGRIFGDFAAAEDVILFDFGRVGKSVDNIFHSLGPALRANLFLFEVFGFHR